MTHAVERRLEPAAQRATVVPTHRVRGDWLGSLTRHALLIIVAVLLLLLRIRVSGLAVLLRLLAVTGLALGVGVTGLAVLLLAVGLARSESAGHPGRTSRLKRLEYG